MRVIKKHIKKLFINMGAFPQEPNPLGKTPGRRINLREFFFKVSSFSQQGEDLTLDRILHRKLGVDLASYKGLYVDAGAYHPLSHSTTYLLYKRGWTGVCVDISEKSCELIKRVRPRDFVVNAATSDFNGELIFEQKPRISLINEATEKTVEHDNKTSTIEALTLDTILHNHNINKQIDYLNIDTEGAELQTLKGLNFSKYCPKVISVEIHANNIESALKTDVANYLLEKGYRCVACNVITYFFIRQNLE